MSSVLVEREGGVHLDVPFIPPPVVKDFIEDGGYCTGYFGPFGCAKTTAGVMKAYCYAQAMPGARIAVIRDTWPNLRDTTQKTFFEWFPEGVAGRYEREPKTFWLYTGAEPVEVIFRAMRDRADIENVLSLDLAAAWADEPQGGVSWRGEQGVLHEPGINEDLFHGILARVGRQQGYHPMAWLTGNPPPPTHWITKLFDYSPGKSGCDAPRNRRHEVIPVPGEAPIDADYRLYLGTQDTNRAHLPRGYYERLERDFGVGTPMARRFLHGHWIEFAASKPFHSEWIRYYGLDEEPDRPQALSIEAGFDPAISTKDTAAYSALVVAGQSRANDLTRGKLYILEAIKGHWTVYEQVHQLIKAIERWKIQRVRIEDVAYQKALAEVLEREARIANIQVHVQTVKPDADKLLRASAWSPLVEDGTVVFGPGQGALTMAMLAVPEDRSQWDLVDAAGICIRGFPVLTPAATRLPWTVPVQDARARGYAIRPPLEEPRAPIRRPVPVGQAPSLRKRAASYAIRPRG